MLIISGVAASACSAQTTPPIHSIATYIRITATSLALAQTPPYAPGDADSDLDLLDFAAFQRCFGDAASSACAPFDLDQSNNVSGTDYAQLRCAILGPSITVPPIVVCPPETPTTSVDAVITGLASWPFIELAGLGKPTLVPLTGFYFKLPISLVPDRVNRIYLTGISESAARGSPTTILITHDSQPPSLFIDFPADGAEITTDVVDVAGRVGDMLSGAKGISVVVNGGQAIVDVGIGNNGTFVRGSVPLQLGDNIITAGAKDLLGNTVQKQIAVKRVAIDEDVPRLAPIAGNGQAAAIGTFLADKLVVKMTHADGTPFVNKVVTFAVIRSNGRLYGETAPNLDGPGTLTLQAHTDEEGIATAVWKVGSDAGCGNNRIEVTSRDVAGSTFFCASALPAPARQINIGSGNNQQVETNAPVLEPLRAWVSDSCNGVRGIPVTFRVLQGGGKVDGLDQVTVFTSLTGHSEATFTTGPEAGNNIIEADFPGNPAEPATFTVVGILRDETQPTRFTGLVLNNASAPLQDAAVLLRVLGENVAQTATDIQGRFVLDDIPTSGQADLFVNGYSVSAAGGITVELGSYPSLHYETLVIPNADYSLPMPVLLPELNPANRRTYTCSTQGQCPQIELTCEGMEGLKMIVGAGTTVTLPGGTKVGPANPGSVVLALNQVHHDDVPMPMPDGAAPPFAWTLQPGGAKFDPPLKIEYPNMSGLPAGAISFFLNFNHDTGRFEIIGGGHVSEDGATIHTDPGVGITTAGWGCNCPPYSVVGKADCCRSIDLWDLAKAGIRLAADLILAAAKIDEALECANDIVVAFDKVVSVWTAVKADGEVSAEEKARLLLLIVPLKDAVVTCADFFNRANPAAYAEAAQRFINGAQAAIDFALAQNCLPNGLQVALRAVSLMNHALSRILDLGEKLDTKHLLTVLVCTTLEAIKDALELANSPLAAPAGDLVPTVDGLVAEATKNLESLIKDNEQTVELNEEVTKDAHLFGFDLEAVVDDLASTSTDVTGYVLSANGQTTQATADGGFNLRNVSAADAFGPTGPGSPPDFLSDEFVRVVGTGIIDGVPHWAFSDPFQIRQGETFVVPPLTITDVPPLLPESIEITAPAPRIKVDEALQLTVTAKLNDGKPKGVDVTERRFWTIYRTSNPAVATVGENGLITAHKVGAAIITASNEAATSTKAIAVVSDFLATTVEGFVHVGVRTPVSQASVGVVCKIGNLWEVAGSAITQPDGSFSIPIEVAVNEAEVLISVAAEIDGDAYLASTFAPALVRDGFTDAGIIKVKRLAMETTSQAFSVYNDVFQHTPVDAIGREFSVYVAPINDPLSDVMSRAFSVFNDAP